MKLNSILLQASANHTPQLIFCFILCVIVLIAVFYFNKNKKSSSSITSQPRLEEKKIDEPLVINTSNLASESNLKMFSPATFGIVIICFFFSFFDLKCNNQVVYSVKGIDLVTGVNDPGKSNIFGGETNRTENPKGQKSIWAIIAITCALLGILAYATKYKDNHRLICGFAGGGFCSMILLGLTSYFILEDNLKGRADWSFGIAFFVALVGFFIAVAIHDELLKYEKKRQQD
ncbi:MAG: hypothetical protein IPO63_01575 [Bacteroidetes bacterium]|nr:hypothetical protein [Bacteroidota bacterium]